MSRTSYHSKKTFAHIRNYLLLALALTVAILMCITLARAGDSSYATSENFHIYGPQDSADFFENHLQGLRDKISTELLGSPLPPGIGKTIVHISYPDPDKEDGGLFWAIESDSDRTMHKLWLFGPDKQSIIDNCTHEMVHLVLASRYPNRLPLWVEEGIASGYDDDKRKQTRADIVDWWKKTGNYPRLRDIIGLPSISAKNIVAYTACASLVEFLNSLETPKRKGVTIVAFAEWIRDNDLMKGIYGFYYIETMDELQKQWEGYLND